MTSPAPSENTAYFLGIEGEQAGPFSEKEVIEKLKSQSVPPDALIWWTGLEDWLAVSEVPQFRTYFSGESTQVVRIVPESESGSEETRQLDVDTSASISPIDSPSENESSIHSSAPKALPSAEDTQAPATFTSDPDGVVPVFSLEDSTFHSSAGLHKKVLFTLFGVFGLAILAAGVFFLFATQTPPLPTAKVKTKEERLAQRQVNVSKAFAELYVTPDKSLLVLKEIVKENPTDGPGKDATQNILDYYRQNQRISEAGKFLMELKRPIEAAKILVQDPNATAEAETALMAAFEASQGQEKQDFLLQDIKLLLGPLNRLDKAVERIQIFEKQFPSVSHPYGYYLLPVDQRIQNIFNRLAFFFVQGLLNHMAAEFPQVNLVGRPLVEVKRNATGDYRIIARYQGEVLLNKERLNNTYFVFWLVGEQWVLVDTNLTRERQKYASAARTKYDGTLMPPNKTLQFLETEFKTQYPKISLHETAPTETKKSKGPQE